MICNDPELYEDRAGNVEWEGSRFDVDQYTRFVFLNDTGWVPDQHLSSSLPPRIQGQVAEIMEGHFEYRGSEQALSALLLSAGISEHPRTPQAPQLKRVGEPWFYEVSNG